VGDGRSWRKGTTADPSFGRDRSAGTALRLAILKMIEFEPLALPWQFPVLIGTEKEDNLERNVETKSE
jgi:hypothetical protein